MFFGGGTIPYFLHVKQFIGLNNIWALIIPCGINSFNLIILRNFFSQVPDDLIENARLEGVSRRRELFDIIIPMIWPTLQVAFIGSMTVVFTAFLQAAVSVLSELSSC